MPISDSHSSAAVIGKSNTADSAGGLLGSCHCDDGGKSVISNSYATGNVEANTTAGGLVGTYLGYITNSYAAGNVTGHASGGTGGFGGQISDATITNCYATGTVTGVGDGANASNWYGATYTATGGFAGIAGRWWDGGTSISGSYSTGDITGTDVVGGFVGYNISAAITDSYSLGSVTATAGSAAGFVSRNDSSITRAYSAAPTVSGTTAFAFVDSNYPGSLANVFYYDNGAVPSDANAIGLDSTNTAGAGMQNSDSFTGFNFSGLVWARPTVNPLTPGGLLFPVLTWQCGQNGVSCAAP